MDTSLYEFTGLCPFSCRYEADSLYVITKKIAYEILLRSYELII